MNTWVSSTTPSPPRQSVVAHPGRSAIRAAASAASGPPASLRPKEHGAHAILALPMLTAVAVAGPSWVGGLTAVAAVAVFLAHEPLLVASGRRGRRARVSTPQASGRLLALAVTAAVAGVAALVVATPLVRWWLLTCLIAAGIGLWLDSSGRQRSQVAQCWAMAGLSLPSVPMLLAGQCERDVAVEIWATWLLGFTATTFVVHSVIAAQKRQSRRRHVGILLLVTGLVLGGWAGGWPRLLAASPMLVTSWYLLASPPPARHLKRVGWTLVAATSLTAVGLGLTA